MPTRPPRARRRTAALLLVLVVLGAHWLLGEQVSDQVMGWGAGDRPALQRMEVAFVRTLAPQQPPDAAPSSRAVAAKPAARAASAVEPAASAASAPRARRAASAPAPTEAPSEPAVMARLEPPADTPVAASEPGATASGAEAPLPAVAASDASARAEVAASPASSAMASDSFEWPPSTRLRYVLTGQYRGEVHGAAQVQWVRRGSRYQVHLDVTVGPGFAPLLSRRATSDGELTDQGLAPRLYDEETKTLFGTPRHASVRFEPERILLANGRVRPALPGVQDTASQFVQLTWLFTRHPEQLRVGNSVAQPLALPRRVDPWVYDILEEQALATPVGLLQTFHLRPRRESVKAGELVAEMWIAPSLQYLPVRIRIEQDEQNFIDLMLDGAPMQAEPAEADRPR